MWESVDHLRNLFAVRALISAHTFISGFSILLDLFAAIFVFEVTGYEWTPAKFAEKYFLGKSLYHRSHEILVYLSTHLSQILAYGIFSKDMNGFNFTY